METCNDECGLTLNAENSRFNMDNLIFVAMLLSKIEGIGPTEEKFKTIMETRKPENVAE